MNRALLLSPGNRANGHDAVYCASAGDKVVFLDVTKGSDSDELSYHLTK